MNRTAAVLLTLGQWRNSYQQKHFVVLITSWYILLWQKQDRLSANIEVLNKALQDAFVSLSMQSSCTAVMINHLQSAELIELHIVESVFKIVSHFGWSWTTLLNSEVIWVLNRRSITSLHRCSYANQHVSVFDEGVKLLQLLEFCKLLFCLRPRGGYDL